MIVLVRMLAFNDPTKGDPIFRQVEVPDAEWNKVDHDGRLGLVFHYGQNDFQPQKCCSVSVGDVIFYPTFTAEVPIFKLMAVAGVGFKPLTHEQYAKLESLPRLYRQTYIYELR